MNESTEFAPYVGPTPFEYNDKDAARFFGRSRETDEIVSLIFGHPLTLVYAQSGAGKTSLINAGIIRIVYLNDYRNDQNAHDFCAGAGVEIVRAEPPA